MEKFLPIVVETVDSMPCPGPALRGSLAPPRGGREGAMAGKSEPAGGWQQAGAHGTLSPGCCVGRWAACPGQGLSDSVVWPQCGVVALSPSPGGRPRPLEPPTTPGLPCLLSLVLPMPLPGPFHSWGSEAGQARRAHPQAAQLARRGVSSVTQAPPRALC